MNSTTNAQAIRTRRAQEQASDYRVSRAVIEGPGAGVSFWVASATKRKIYLVHEGRCDCLDYVNRCQDAEGTPNGLKCKHILLCEDYLGINERLPVEEQEMDEVEAATLTAELQRETDAEMERIRRERDLLWPA